MRSRTRLYYYLNFGGVQCLIVQYGARSGFCGYVKMVLEKFTGYTESNLQERLLLMLGLDPHTQNGPARRTIF